MTYINPFTPADQVARQSKRQMQRDKEQGDPVANEMIRPSHRNEPVKPAWMLRREAEAREAEQRLLPDD